MKRNNEPKQKRDHLSRSELIETLVIRDKPDKSFKEELARMRANFAQYLYEHSEPIT